MDGMADGSRGELGRRLEAAAWGVVLFLVGADALPAGDPRSILIAAGGAMLLAISGIRVSSGIEVRWFTIILGSVALLAGIGHLVGITVPSLALLLMLAGMAVVIGQVASPRRSAPVG